MTATLRRHLAPLIAATLVVLFAGLLAGLALRYLPAVVVHLYASLLGGLASGMGA